MKAIFNSYKIKKLNAFFLFCFSFNIFLVFVGCDKAKTEPVDEKPQLSSEEIKTQQTSALFLGRTVVFFRMTYADFNGGLTSFGYTTNDRTIDSIKIDTKGNFVDHQHSYTLKNENLHDTTVEETYSGINISKSFHIISGTIAFKGDSVFIANFWGTYARPVPLTSFQLADDPTKYAYDFNPSKGQNYCLMHRYIPNKAYVFSFASR